MGKEIRGNETYFRHVLVACNKLGRTCGVSARDLSHGTPHNGRAIDEDREARDAVFEFADSKRRIGIPNSREAIGCGQNRL